MFIVLELYRVMLICFCECVMYLDWCTVCMALSLLCVYGFIVICVHDDCFVLCYIVYVYVVRILGVYMLSV